MGPLTPSALLAGPRGRRLCLAVAHRLHYPVWSSLFHAALHPFDPALRQDLADRLREVDVAELSTWQEPTRLVPAVADSVDRAMYWQEPDEEDMVAATPGIFDALEPIAVAIASSPAAAWWTEPADLAHLRYTDRYDPSHHDEPDQPPLLTGASEKLTSWRNSADRGSGHWWSGPLGHGLPWTTRPLPGLGSTALVWEEDTVGHSSARVWHLRTTRTPRIYEIDSAAAWTTLAATYPLDVTRSTGQEWGQVTGLDGPWLIPITEPSPTTSTPSTSPSPATSKLPPAHSPCPSTPAHSSADGTPTPPGGSPTHSNSTRPSQTPGTATPTTTSPPGTRHEDTASHLPAAGTVRPLASIAPARHFSSVLPLRVAVIGASATAVAAARAVHALPGLVFDPADGVGGAWAHERRDPGIVCRNDRDTYAFTSSPCPA